MDDMQASQFCNFLAWDSEFFGIRIARLELGGLRHGAVDAVIEWCVTHDIDCLYYLCDVADDSSIRIAEENVFNLVDVRLTLEKRLENTCIPRSEVASNVLVRQCSDEDIPALTSIARTSHRDSRFYNDLHFPDSICDSLYETWIEKSCHGYADVVFVPEIDGRPAGYLSCQLPDENEGQIGLVAIDEISQGRRLGQNLVNESLQWFAKQGVFQVKVVTQGRNLRAQRLYQRCGFLPKQMQLWYHRWFRP